MDIEKFLKWGSEYFSDYVYVFVSTLQNPTLRFQPVTSEYGLSHVDVPANLRYYVGPKLNPKLFGFMIISIFIGTTLNSTIATPSTSVDMLTTSVVTLTVWFVYSVTIFGLCKLLGGKAGFSDTISVSLQLLAVIYVVSNVLVFLWGLLASTSIVYSLSQGRIFEFFVDNPIFLYYFIQFALMFIYLPIAVKKIHGFGRRRLLFITLIPLIWALFAIAVYFENSLSQVSSPQIFYTPSP